MEPNLSNENQTWPWVKQDVPRAFNGGYPTILIINGWIPR